MDNVTGVNKDLLRKLKGKLKLSVLGMMMAATIAGCGQTHEGTTAEQMLTSVFNAEEMIDMQEYNSYHLDYSDATDEDLKGTLKENTTYFSLYHCNYITSLDYLPELCPNLKQVTINCCPSITDLEFIKKLPNLESVYIYESAYVTPELVKYLDEAGIEHNITEQDLDNARKIDEIISSIITDDMSDREKIEAITNYVMENLEYDLDYADISNEHPLTCTLNEKKCVCAGYAYLTNILLKKAGIDAYEITSTDHAWNLIREDDNYYYLDVTNIDANYKTLFNIFGNSPLYMSEPDSTRFSAMTSYNAGPEEVVIPKSIIEEIENAPDEATLIDKYGEEVISVLKKYVLPTIGIVGVLAGGKVLLDMEVTKAKKKQKAKKERKEQERKEKINEKLAEKEREKRLERQKEIQEQLKETKNKENIKEVKEPVKEEIKPEPKQLTKEELFIRKMNDLYDRVHDRRYGEMFEYYSNFVNTYPDVSFIDYLKIYSKNKETNLDIVEFETIKQDILRKAYDEFVTKTGAEGDMKFFKIYCQRSSKDINDLGGYGHLIQDTDLEAFIVQMNKELETGKKIG